MLQGPGLSSKKISGNVFLGPVMRRLQIKHLKEKHLNLALKMWKRKPQITHNISHCDIIYLTNT